MNLELSAFWKHSISSSSSPLSLASIADMLAPPTRRRAQFLSASNLVTPLVSSPITWSQTFAKHCPTTAATSVTRKATFFAPEISHILLRLSLFNLSDSGMTDRKTVLLFFSPLPWTLISTARLQTMSHLNTSYKLSFLTKEVPVLGITVVRPAVRIDNGSFLTTITLKRLHKRSLRIQEMANHVAGHRIFCSTRESRIEWEYWCHGY
jgi:hypothetical protein